MLLSQSAYDALPPLDKFNYLSRELNRATKVFSIATLRNLSHAADPSNPGLSSSQTPHFDRLIGLMVLYTNALFHQDLNLALTIDLEIQDCLTNNVT